ncbi:hypothetical protein [Nostoc sp. 106C]|uniref:hypothetical protein n=1 Tax=Nostoc sp. 106C TaxID=1932667 RepID=UPI000B757E9C|nr:hypothetical protein [Nostoc sp. 106C]OUL25697.1 hypothetical protein BV378_15060 [Nostoc sp. RF31YmG]OUL31095.1 hypothetical protein BV375_12815 [Nostoc sp. 106C]
MEKHKKSYNGHLEINSLIDDAVNNAIARRNQGLVSEDALAAVSDEEAKNVAGGLASTTTTIGLIAKPPIIVGIIAIPTETI